MILEIAERSEAEWSNFDLLLLFLMTSYFKIDKNLSIKNN
jgi:hypothetical protein